MKTLKALPLIMAVAALGLAGCEDGPAESAGEKIDNTMTEMGNKVEDACEDAKEGMGAEDSDC